MTRPVADPNAITKCDGVVFFCRKRTSSLKTVEGSPYVKEGEQMSMNVPGWIPGAPNKDDTLPVQWLLPV